MENYLAKELLLIAMWTVISKFFEIPPPKSLDRLDLFDEKILKNLKSEFPADVMATYVYNG